MTMADRERWDAKYEGRDIPTDIEPPDWLTQHMAGTCPKRALDVACGLGHAAIWLAEYGWDVIGIDISPAGLEIARRFAAASDLHVEFVQADLDSADLGTEEFDLITVFRFLDRATLPSRLVRALRPKGILIYETFLATESWAIRGPSNPAFLLSPGELPSLFPQLTTLAYEETKGPEAMARFVGLKS